MMKVDSKPSEVGKALCDAAKATHGHFLFESGLHGDLWLDLDALFVDTDRVQYFASLLADKAIGCRPDIVCGPLTGGAFLAALMAAEMGARFCFAERQVTGSRSVHYRVPDSLRADLAGRRVLLVDDAISMGSALLATLADLADCGVEIAGLAALMVLGDAAEAIAKSRGVQLYTLTSIETGIWEPSQCPLCRSGVVLIDHQSVS